MIFINVTYPNADFEMVKGDIEINDGIITRVVEKIEYDLNTLETIVDCEDFYIVPGFVDIHTHGFSMADASDGIAEGIQTMADNMLSHGVTTFCPTVMSLPKPDIEKALASIKEAKEKQKTGALIGGINLEGPFLATSKKGAQKEESIIDPDFEYFQKLQEISGNNIRIVGIAPEKNNAMDFISKAHELCTVSIAHTNADFDITTSAFEHGASNVTHLFNAMNGLHHRNPGVVGAFLDSENVTAELICDGQHIHPAIVRSMFKAKADDIVVVSDSMRLAGMKNGSQGDLGGQLVTVNDGKATLSDGTIAGSVTDMHTELLNLISWGVPLNQALKALSLNPARAINMDNEIGSIEVGKKAHLLVLDKELNICGINN